MKIADLLRGITVVERRGSCGDIEIRSIVENASTAGSDFAFVARRGSAQDGHRYISQAVSRGASLVVLQDKTYLPDFVPGDICYVLVQDSRAALTRMAENFYGDPYRNLSVVGVTGTNGKTTVSCLVRAMMQRKGHRCGLIGTIGYDAGQGMVPASNTTPGPLEMHSLGAEMVGHGCDALVMEVSSHALDQGRVDGMAFESALFTNLTQDHLDYHKNMDDYFRAKRKLFVDYSTDESFAVINEDDLFGHRLAPYVKGRLLRYGACPGCDIRLMDFELSPEGSRARVQTSSGLIEIQTPLVGKHNLYNVMAAIAFGVAHQYPVSVILEGIRDVRLVPGRLDRVGTSRGFSVYVDYAHTDDALKNVLAFLREVSGQGKIITVFGCGGNRDTTKRPKMGRVASELSDHCVVTSDNPRHEAPDEIIAQIVSGMVGSHFEVEPDRQTAIRKALVKAQPGDLVLVAGKGHEDYQIIGDRAMPFDDKKIVERLLSEMEGHV